MIRDNDSHLTSKKFEADQSKSIKGRFKDFFAEYPYIVFPITDVYEAIWASPERDQYVATKDRKEYVSQYLSQLRQDGEMVGVYTLGKRGVVSVPDNKKDNILVERRDLGQFSNPERNPFALLLSTLAVKSEIRRNVTNGLNFAREELLLNVLKSFPSSYFRILNDAPTLKRNEEDVYRSVMYQTNQWLKEKKVSPDLFIKSRIMKKRTVSQILHSVFAADFTVAHDL